MRKVENIGPAVAGSAGPVLPALGRVLVERRCVGVEEACLCVGTCMCVGWRGVHIGWRWWDGKSVGWRKYVWDGGCGDQWREV